mgnify:CR=1 FL=1
MKKRSEVAIENTWKLEDMYATPEDWEKDLERLRVLANELKGMREQEVAFISRTLKATAKELKTRKPDKEKRHRIRAVLAGSIIDDPDFIKLIEDSGVAVVADRHCLGAFPGRTPIELNETEDVLEQICRHYVMQCQCPRYMDNDRIAARKEYLDRLAKEYKADGIIIQQMNFCNFWPYERAGASLILTQEYGWPVLSIDRPYVVGSSGQIRTRVQAFVESVEIKKLQGGER